MTEHKFTDEDIVMDLQNASEWFKEHGKNTNTAIIGICERAVDLINRQREEIERMKAGWDYIPAEAAQALRERAVTEAIKEFAESIKAYYDHIDKTVGALINYTIDQKLKEFLGEGGGKENG